MVAGDDELEFCVHATEHFEGFLEGWYAPDLCEITAMEKDIGLRCRQLQRPRA